ncbi:MAG: hypothetical protein HY347_09815 [candidate division NC10 bacterium]|nr:hypothetical protein [candidate division NC10 bacterium]
MGRTILISLLLSLTVLVGSVASQALLDFEVTEGSEWEEDVFEEMAVSTSYRSFLADVRRLLSKKGTLSFFVSIPPPDQPPEVSPSL